ncbi:MAG: PspC domain-containing protein [Bacteroidales bacterium]|nr:PspC domain-containing protein [Bacteroidales bacterium]MCI5618770.1 PspC domain-containing protein [Rikenellaceae bacterium]
MKKKLYRSRNDKMLAGVCGGVANYFEIDPVIVRLIWLATVCCWGGGLVAYIVGMIVIPLEPFGYIDEQ